MKKYYKIFVRPHLKGIIVAVIAIATAAFISAIAPVISGKITTQLATDSINILNSVDGASVNFSYILNIIKTLGMLYVAAALLTYSSTWILTNEMQNMMNEVRCEVSRKIHNLPVSYFDAHPLGDVLSRVSNDIEVLAVALFQSFSQMITTVLTVVLCAAIMIKINLLLAIVALMIIPCSLIISKVLVKLSQKHFNKQQSMLGKLNGCTQEMFTNFTEIKLYGKQDDAIEEFKTINEELKKSGHHAQFVSSIMNPLIALSTYLIIIIVAILGAFNILAGSLSIGNLQAFIRYIWQVYEPISTVSQLSSSIQSAISAAKRVYEFLEEEEELETIKDPNISFKPTNISSIKFDHVKFAYNE
ncbi:MAG: ABC transporter ATP-binding protein, partial [Erysipelotrichaceae bacterium]